MTCLLAHRSVVPLMYSGPLVTSDYLGFSAPLNDLVQRPYNALGWQREVDINGQPFAVVIVDRVEQSDAAAIDQLVVHKVLRPRLIDGCRHGQRLRLLPHNQLPWFDAQVQLQFAIDAVHALVIPGKTLHVTQEQEAHAEASVALVVRQANQRTVR